ncbi:hypothetical protein DL766_003361 [Monosporascus sp. MC13-8B]|uniref:PBSP domain-containing protein n=1 Tax=Monosporascus cannonballus TaxID=155416 RepID=A0ABY0HDL1_9PEZI|nr:hypothetical protein DL762_002371 [Monosporascus cannonballus]RYO99199.1 hypothetical protein DL763_001689 [Monosporascus cannonballus]RYP33612.1 hypothetical protein DL766_003361 [Monosporascus sp. MC13-8B]
MPLPPFTTPVPQPVFMPGMSRKAEGPPPEAQASPVPIRPKPVGDDNGDDDDKSSDSSRTLSKHSTPSSSSASTPGGTPFPLPKLRLQINDLTHAGAAVFLTSVAAESVLETGVRSVLRALYVSPGSPEWKRSAPGTRSVTLVLRDMGGVAYTAGTELDDAHKEIHLSMRYVSGIAPPAPERRTSEITGVLVHELVHCFQHNGRGACPGGLVEGVADFVRLRCGLAPPHWRRPGPPGDGGDNGAPAPPNRWDAGYQHTAYFLDYLEGRFGEGTVRRLNEKLCAERYEEKRFWTELLGRPVKQLWQDYRDEVLGGGDDKGESEKTTLAAVSEATQT